MGPDLIGVLLLLGGGFLFVIYLIAADRQRFLTRFDVNQWREGYYLRALPNFLQALHDNHFRTAWPSRCNAVSAAFFQMRTWPMLGRGPRKLRKAFLQQHITLFGLLEILRPYIHDFILHERQRIVGNCCIDMEDTLDRERLINYLEELRAHRDNFKTSLTHYDRQIMVDMLERQIIPTLRRTHAMFQEHGFSLLTEFTELRRWQEMTGPELAQELPPLPPLPRERRQKVGA